LLFFVLAALYVLAPGHPELPLAGIPIGQSGIVALVAVALVGSLSLRRQAPRSASLAMAVLVGVKVAAALMVPEPGWLAYYHAGPLDDPHERSTDYRSLSATRIDRQLAFADTTFPVHFFNDRRFDRGFRREFTEPFAVRWTGVLNVAEPETIELRMRARGSASVSIDRRELARIDSPADAAASSFSFPVTGASHAIEVRYSKPADTEGLLELLKADSGAPWRADISPTPVTSWQAKARGPLRVLSGIAHVMAFGLVVIVSAPLLARWNSDLRTQWRTSRADAVFRASHPAVVIGLTLQGLWKTRHLIGRVWTLTGGDDWMTFEHNARDVVLNGLLMPLGAPLGEGRPYFAYPGYTYFTAFVHAVTGESLAGVVLMNFIVLAVATLLVLRLARLLVSPWAAILAVLWFLALQQADFVRYYTVTLLSENLYVLTAAGMVLALSGHMQYGRSRDAMIAAAWGGLSSLTRPSAMLFLPLAMVLVGATAWRKAGAPRAAGLAVAFVAVWMAVIAPATVRNAIVSGEPVLISSGQAKSFIDYNMPPGNPKRYLDMFDGSLTSAGAVLFRMLLEQPRPFLSAIGVKLAFGLGMVHWAAGVSPHPELILTTLLYIVAIFAVPAARTAAALPIHFFIATHLASLTLTLPWNYGYRMILAMYPFMAVFAGGVIARALPAQSR
jgi:hypothetical protein